MLTPSPSLAMPTRLQPISGNGASALPWRPSVTIWMTPPETALFASVLQTNCEHAYLEFGAGGSTLFAMGIVPQVVSVESDARFIRRLRWRALFLPHRSSPAFLRPDVGPVGEWGFPVTDDPAILPRYAEEPWKHADLPSGIRTVLVDGRFRRACLLQSLLHLPADIDYMLHDANRYADFVPDFFTVVEQAGALQHLRRRPGVTESYILDRLEQVRLDKN